MLALGARPDETPDERGRRALLVGISLMVLPAGVIWGAIYLAADEPVAALFPWGYAIASLLCLLVFVRTRSFAFLSVAELLLILVTPAALMVSLGGFAASGGVIVWSFLAPLGALVWDRKRAWAWYAVFVVLVAAAVVLGPVVRPDAAGMPQWLVHAFGALNLLGVSLVAFTLLAVFARQREAALHRVQSLLLNILPGEIAHRLQHEPETIADHFDDASILFADVVDFTPLASRLHATEIVGLLDRLFSAFDDLADRYEVEKIKTIGDCYMVAAGVPSPRDDHAHALVRMALEMHECARVCLPTNGRGDLQLRIGIASGPVVAGVIGRRRFLYDLWGDTVNMASRMESHGVPGSIQITRSTWELVRDEFVVEPRGLVHVKGKGEVETWHVVGAGV
jgi:adenylate cyclase